MVEQNNDPFGDINDLLDAIDAQFAGGGKFDVSKDPQPSEQESLRSAKGMKATLIAQCLHSILPPGVLEQLKEEGVDFRRIAIPFGTEVKKWKAKNIEGRLKEEKADEIEIIGSITYSDMVIFSKGRFDEFCAQSGLSIPFSHEQKRLQKTVDYWSWMEQVTQEAEDQEKRNQI